LNNIMSGQIGEKNKRGKVVVLSGPSGVGKSTICMEVIKRLPNVHLSVSCTTRPRAATEVNGREYWFVPKEEFEHRISKGLFLEYAEVFGNLYGTPKDKVDEALDEGKTIILEIDVQGGRQAKAVYLDAIMIFILPPGKRDLVDRLDNRGRDSNEKMKERLGFADTEIAIAQKYYEYKVVNADLETAINEVIGIIKKNIGDSK
jgi:guanylate kinase